MNHTNSLSLRRKLVEALSEVEGPHHKDINSKERRNTNKYCQNSLEAGYSKHSRHLYHLTFT
jgi:hypothetical protein